MAAATFPAMASNLLSDGLQTASDGLHTTFLPLFRAPGALYSTRHHRHEVLNLAWTSRCLELQF